MRIIPILLEQINRRFLLILFALYSLAIVLPWPGSVFNHLEIGRLSFLNEEPVLISLPLLFLMTMLFNSSLMIRQRELAVLFEKPTLLLGGFVGNLLLPLGFILFLCGMFRLSGLDGAVLILGLSMIATMPIANSTLVWSQNVNGNMALSLGLVLLSTLLSPITTPILLTVVSFAMEGKWALILQEIAVRKTSPLLLISVVTPSILGLVLRFLVGQRRLEPCFIPLKLLNLLIMMVLIYVNAVAVLPQLSWQKDAAFLTVSLLSTSALCILGFAGGRNIGILLKALPGECASLMYALGMNSSVVGLVLSMSALAAYPKVMIPILCYNMVQQVVAGFLRNHDLLDPVKEDELEC